MFLNVRGSLVAVRRHWDWHFAALLAVFFASRLVAHWCGVSLETRADYQWQLLEPDLLSNRLVESVFYLHAQPPAFNALHGLVLKLASANLRAEQLLWTALQLSFGLGILVGIYGTLVICGVSRCLAAIAAALFICAPSALVYENFLSYTYINASLLSLSALTLAHFLRHRRSASVWAFFLLLASICLTRPIYHFLWLIVVSVLVVVQTRRIGVSRRTLLGAVLVANLLVASVYVKNGIVFGFFGASSWSGMNIATMTYTNLGDSTRRAVVEKGIASPLAAVGPFLPLDVYPSQFRSAQPTGIPALDRRTRFDGSPNFNNQNYLSISTQYGRDARALASYRPAEYVKSVVRNLVSFFFRSSTDYLHVSRNVTRIRRWDALYSVVIYGQFGSLPRLWSSDQPVDGSDTLRQLPLGVVIARKAKESCLFLALMVLLLPGYAISRALKGRAPSDVVFASFVALTVVYVAAASNLGNFGETHRMRFEVEPLLMILLGLLIVDLRRWRQARREHSSPMDVRVG